MSFWRIVFVAAHAYRQDPGPPTRSGLATVVQPTARHGQPPDGVTLENRTQNIRRAAPLVKTTSFLDGASAEMLTLIDLYRDKNVPVHTDTWPDFFSTIGIFCAEGLVLLTVTSLAPIFWPPKKTIEKEILGGKGADRQKGAEPSSLWFLLGALALWFTSCIMIQVFNKWIFLPRGGNFPHPLLLSAVHQLATAVVMQTLRISPVAADWMPAVAQKGALAGLGFQGFAKKVMPPALLYAASLGLGNKAAMNLSVAFTQMLKAPKPALVYLSTLAIGMEAWDRERLILVCLACAASCAAAAGEVNFCPVGVAYQCATHLTEIGRLICLKKLVSLPELDPLSALALFSQGCVASLLGPVLFLEFSPALLGAMWAIRWQLLASVAVALMVNFASIVFMKCASPTLVCVTGNLMYVVTALLSAYIFDTVVTMQQMFCLICTIACVQAFVIKGGEKKK